MKRLISIDSAEAQPLNGSQGAILTLPEGCVVIIATEDIATALRPLAPGPYMLVELDVWTRTLNRAVQNQMPLDDVPRVSRQARRAQGRQN